MSTGLIIIEAMTIEDYDDAVRLWQEIPELRTVPFFDTRERIGAYLARNSGLSSIARADDRIVGTVLCSYDGRRGHLIHMGVAPDYRKQGIARRLVERCLEELRAVGIDTVALYTNSPVASAFWQHLGFEVAPNISYYSRSF